MTALGNLVNKTQRLTTASIEMQGAIMGAALPRKVEDEFLRIAQEALSNAVKHARALRR
ncbi:MAG: hypothetical protein H7039_01230 [Bryobacteraceae bacterium]|nr:hypothetical protein [Bryobacteraceae bacterium]